MDIDLIRELLDPTATADEARRLAVARQSGVAGHGPVRVSPRKVPAGHPGSAAHVLPFGQVSPAGCHAKASHS